MSHAMAEDLQQRVAIKVTPDWELFAGWSDAKGVLSGSVLFRVEWNLTQADKLLQHRSDLRDIVAPLNLVPSGSSHVQIGDLLLTTERKDEIAGAKVFAGDWKQDVDGTCYPFDDQVAQFRFGILSPTSRKVVFQLFCRDQHAHEPSHCTSVAAPGEKVGLPRHLEGMHDTPVSHQVHGVGMQDSSGANVVQTVSSKIAGASGAGFTWSEFTCDLGNPHRILCHMRGTRAASKVMLKYWCPGVLMTTVSFASFLIPISMSMPRVATTMIALLAFVQLYREIASVVPSSGTSWLEEFYIIGTGFLMLNTIGHVVSFRLHKYEFKVLGTHFYRHCDRFCFAISPIAFVLIMACRLYTRDCMNVWAALPILLVSACLLPVILLVIIAIQVKELMAIRNAESAIAECEHSQDDPTVQDQLAGHEDHVTSQDSVYVETAQM